MSEDELAHKAAINDRTGEAVRSALVWNIAHQGISQLVGAAVFIYLANRLDPIAFGIFALAVLFIDAFAQQAKVALVDVILMRRDFSSETLSSLFYAASAVAAVAWILIAIAVPAAPWADMPEQLGSVVSVLGLVILLAPFGAVLESLILRDVQFHALAMRNIATTILSGVAAIVAVQLEASEWALVAQRITSVFSGTLVLVYFVRWLPAAKLRWSPIRQMATPFLKAWLDQIVVFGLARVVDLIIGLRFGAAHLGLYRVATRILEVVESASNTPLTGVFVPVLSRHADDPERWAAHYLQIVSISALFTAPLLGGLALLSSDIVETFLSPAYAGSGPVLAIIATAGLVAPLTQFRSVALIGARRPGLAATLSIADLGATSLFAMAGSLYGLQGVMFGVLAAASLAALLAAAVFYRSLGISPALFLRACAPPYVAALVMALSVHVASFALTQEQAPFRLAVLVPFGAFVFTTWLLVVYRGWLIARLGYLYGRDAKREWCKPP